MRTIAILMTALALGTGLIACKDNTTSGSPTSTPAATSASITPGATSSSNTPAATTVPTPIPTVQGVPTVTASGLTIIDVTVGSGAEAKSTDTITANYTGYLASGTIFDASSLHGGPAQFTLANVIKGWQEGLPGMKVGGKRRLIIPPDLAYGSSGAGSTIPPNATLTFDVELVSIP